jgi:coenzyme F420 hydrogenase subunit beta
MHSSFIDLKADVVDKGLCTGCGTCVGVCPHECLIMKREKGEPEPALTGTCPGCKICYESCPGKNIPLESLEDYVFGTKRVQSSQDIGVCRFIGRGHASDPTVRRLGTSGGIVSAILQFGFDHGLIDSALVTGFDKQQPYYVKPYLVTSRNQVIDFAQSKYAMVPVNELLGEAGRSPELHKLAVVGCPCHIHGIRKLQMSKMRPDITKKVTLLIGLFCATQFYFEGTHHILFEECGVKNLKEIQSIQYRGGDWPGHFIVETKSGNRIEVDRHHYVYHLLLPGYRRDRCMMCLDWSSELSDLSVGDYGPVKEDGENQLGESTIIVRSAMSEEFLREGERKGYIRTMPLEKDHILGSPGLELKKHSAGYRWAQRRLYGWPIPDYQYEPDFQPVSRKTYFLPEKKK